MLRSASTRKLLWTVLALLVAALAAPVVSVNFWHARIAAALSRGLGRPVRLGAVHLKLLGGPGFDIDRVIIEEDPRFGIEPFVRMESLEATLSLSSLWRNRMQFSSLVFVHPSINLVRNAKDHWNLAPLWKPATAGASAASSRIQSAAGKPFRPLPNIQIETGRINFKLENTKQVYIIDHLDMEITPPSSANEPWRLSFDGRPNRTDFLLNPVSHFHGQAAFGPFSPLQKEAGILTRVDLTTQNAFIGELLKIFTGNDYGIHGSLNLHLRLAGTTSLLRVSGSADVHDLYGWDRLPPAAPLAQHVDLSAILDIEKDFIELRSLSIPISQGSVLVRGDIDELFQHPRPALRAEIDAVPLADIVEMAKQFTGHLDNRLVAHGSVDGYAEINGGLDALSGAITVAGARFQEKGMSRPTRLSNFKVVLDGSTGQTGPVTVNLGRGSKLASSVEWDIAKHKVTARLQGYDVRLDSFLPWARSLRTGWQGAKLSGGDLALSVSISSGCAGTKVIGWAQISNALLKSAAVNKPIAVTFAQLQFQPGVISAQPFSAALGPLEVEGSFVAKMPPQNPSLAASARRPNIKFNLRSPQVDIAELDGLLNPRYRPTSFFRFERSHRTGSTFFAKLAAEGNVQIGALNYRDHSLQDLKAAVTFRNGLLALTTFAGTMGGGEEGGKAVIQFGKGPPAFNIQTHFANVDLRQLAKKGSFWRRLFFGKVSGDLRLAGAGWDLSDILTRLGGSGEMKGRNLELRGIDLTRSNVSASKPLTRVRSFSSSFQILKRQVVISDLKIVPRTGVGAFFRPARGEPIKSAVTVTGAVGFDRTLDLIVTGNGGAPAYHLGGTLAAPLASDIAASLHSTPE